MAQTSGTYEHGKIVLDQPVDWPEGSPVSVICQNGTTPDRRVDGAAWDESSQGVESWLSWFDSAEPVLGEEELEKFETGLRVNREREKALSSAWENSIDKLSM